MDGVTIGLIHEPMVGETHCGDAYLVLETDASVLVAVADGLGHGAEAELAAHKAIEEIRERTDQPLERILEACHLALKPTRGAVLAIARIEREHGRLVHTGLGNVESRIIARDRVFRPVTINGIAGHSARKFRTEVFPFQAGDLLIMHTDGISDRFELSAASRGRDLQMLAKQIAQSHGRTHDDQLLLIVRLDP